MWNIKFPVSINTFVIVQERFYVVSVSINTFRQCLRFNCPCKVCGLVVHRLCYIIQPIR